MVSFRLQKVSFRLQDTLHVIAKEVKQSPHNDEGNGAQQHLYASLGIVSSPRLWQLKEEMSLPTRTEWPNNVTYTSFVEDDFRVRGVFLDLGTQAVHT